jgi:hypothetical protein
MRYEGRGPRASASHTVGCGTARLSCEKANVEQAECMGSASSGHCTRTLPMPRHSCEIGRPAWWGFGEPAEQLTAHTDPTPDPRRRPAGYHPIQRPRYHLATSRRDTPTEASDGKPLHGDGTVMSTRPDSATSCRRHARRSAHPCRSSGRGPFGAGEARSPFHAIPCLSLTPTSIRAFSALAGVSAWE